jgi:steroid delta-isomerase
MRNIATALACLALQVAAPASLAVAQEDAAATIRAALERWTADFNAGRADKVCDLFAPDLRAEFRGAPERGYDEQCRLLQRALADRTRRYANAFEIKEIIVAGDLAVVRLVWTSTIAPQDAPPVVIREPGMDVFRRQPDGSWKIARYMAYEAPR